MTTGRPMTAPSSNTVRTWTSRYRKAAFKVSLAMANRRCIRRISDLKSQISNHAGSLWLAEQRGQLFVRLFQPGRFGGFSRLVLSRRGLFGSGQLLQFFEINGFF